MPEWHLAVGPGTKSNFMVHALLFPPFVGAAFTRFQTLRLQRIFPEVLAEQLISYGSCQFPTLGFVVERFKAIQAFVPEVFHRIKGKALRFFSGVCRPRKTRGCRS